MKPVIFLGDSLVRLRGFPQGVRRQAGYQVERVQRGLDPDDWKPMTSIGQGVREIRIRDISGAYRVMYLATFADAIYVLHAFAKKTQRTPTRDLQLAELRLKELKRRAKG